MDPNSNGGIPYAPSSADAGVLIKILKYCKAAFCDDQPTAGAIGITVVTKKDIVSKPESLDYSRLIQYEHISNDAIVKCVVSVRVGKNKQPVTFDSLSQLIRIGGTCVTSLRMDICFYELSVLFDVYSIAVGPPLQSVSFVPVVSAVGMEDLTPTTGALVLRDTSAALAKPRSAGARESWFARLNPLQATKSIFQAAAGFVDAVTRTDEEDLEFIEQEKNKIALGIIKKRKRDEPARVKRSRHQSSAGQGGSVNLTDFEAYEESDYDGGAEDEGGRGDAEAPFLKMDQTDAQGIPEAKRRKMTPDSPE